MAQVVISIRKTIMVVLVLFIIYKYFIDPTPLNYANDDNVIKNMVENYIDDDTEQDVVQVTGNEGDVVSMSEFDEVKEENDKSDDVSDNKCGGFVSSELLPDKDETDEFAEFSPVNVDNNFLDASRFLSMQTSLLRNTNLQIRPEPEVPREKVCPWNQSTIYRENTEPRNRGFHNVKSEDF